jgi:hypothetical protein
LIHPELEKLMARFHSIAVGLATIGMIYASGASATPINNPLGGIGSSGEQSLQDILDGIADDGDIGFDVANDFVSPDLFWVAGTGGVPTANIIIEVAGNRNSNTVGIYERGDVGNKIDLFAGSAAAGDRVVLSFTDTGSSIDITVADADSFSIIDNGTFASSQFGWFLDGPGGTFFSDDSDNADGYDHMLAYEGNGELVTVSEFSGPFLQDQFILAWEDLPGTSADWDYNDFVFLAQSVRPVAAPGVIGILGALLFVTGIRRRARGTAA